MARRPTAGSLDSPPSELVAELEVGTGLELECSRFFGYGTPDCMGILNMEQQFLGFGRYHGHEKRFHVQFEGCRYERGGKRPEIQKAPKR